MRLQVKTCHILLDHSHVNGTFRSKVLGIQIVQREIFTPLLRRYSFDSIIITYNICFWNESLIIIRSKTKVRQGGVLIKEERHA